MGLVLDTGIEPVFLYMELLVGLEPYIFAVKAQYPYL